MGEAQLSGVGSVEVHYSRTPAADLCHHRRIREIGQDFDESGRLLSSRDATVRASDARIHPDGVVSYGLSQV